MKSKFFKRLIPMALGGVAMLVLAMPMTASAHDWDHHDNGVHNGWVHRDQDDFHRWDRDHNAFRFAPRAYYPNNYYARPPIPVYSAPGYGAPAYGYGYEAPYGFGGCNEARLQNVYRYDRRTGHTAAANAVARQMRNCGGGLYGQNNVFGNLFGGW